MPWLESLFRKRVEVALPPEVERQSQEALSVLVNIHGLIELRGFGSAFMRPETWDPNRRRKPSDIDLAAIYSNIPELSCFAEGPGKVAYPDEEGDFSYYPAEPQRRIDIRSQVESVAPLVSLNILTEKDIQDILRGRDANYRVFAGVTDLKRFVHDIQKGKLLWPK